MKVVVHLNHGIDKSYLLTIKARAENEVRQILDRNDTEAAQQLFIRSAKMEEISPKDKLKAETIADFVVSQYGYTAERLA